MSDTKIDDPLRRKPPTIDLKANEVRTKNAEASASASAAASAAGPADDEDAARTAIEPMATTGLDRSATSAKPAPGAKPTSVPLQAAKAGPAKVEPIKGDPAKSEPPKSEPPKPEPAKSEPAKSEPPKTVSASAGAAAASADPSQPKGGEALPPAAPARKEARRGLGFGALLAASLLGGLIGAGILFAAEPYWRKPDELGSRVATLEQRVNALGNLGPLTQRLGALETARTDLGRTLAETRTLADATAKQLADLAGRPVPAAGPVPADPALPAAVAGLRDRLAAAEQASGRIAQTLAELGRQVELWRRSTDERLTSATTGLAALQATTAPMPSTLQTLQAGSTAIQSGLQGLQGAVGGLQGDAKTLQTRLQEQAARIDAASAELAKLSAPAIQAGLRIAVSARLDDALRAGAPLGPPVAALEKLGADPAALAVLKPYGQSPPPSAALLARDFAPVADRILAEPRSESTSFTDRLMRVADKLVTVRSLGDGSGTDTPGLVARIQNALAAGRVAEALTAWNSLPEAAKATSASWAEALKNRVAVEDAARRIGATALAALDSATR